MAESEEAAALEIRLMRRQVTAAAGVLRGYLNHQRERLGGQAPANENFRLVEGALAALDAALAQPRTQT